MSIWPPFLIFVIPDLIRNPGRYLTFLLPFVKLLIIKYMIKATQKVTVNSVHTLGMVIVVDVLVSSEVAFKYIG